MDPISAGANIIAVLDLVYSVIGYINKTRHASQERAQILVECSNTFALLTNLNLRLETCNTEDPWFVATRPLFQSGSALEQLRLLLNKLGSKLRPKEGLGKAVQTLRWPLDKSDVKEALETMERLKNLINIALTSENVTISLAIQKEVTGISIGVNELQQTFQERNKMLVRQEMLKWLNFANNDIVHRRIVNDRCPYTGTWLRYTEPMKAWLEAENTFLWLTGTSGCGKSTLVSACLDDIILPLRSEKIGVAYHYCNFQDPQSQTLSSVLGSIIGQLCEQFGLAADFVEDSFNQHSNSAGQKRDPDLDTLKKLLSGVLRIVPGTILVVDAVDECESRHECFETLAAAVQNHAVKIFATSRPEDALARIISSCCRYYKVQVEPADIQNDIEEYVKQAVVANERWRSLDTSIKESVIVALTQEANGMFRWVRCQVEELQKARTNNGMKQALKNLPSNLEETYARILDLQSDSDRGMLCKALIWLAFADRPMMVYELSEAVILENDFVDVEADSRLNYPEDLLDICSAFIMKKNFRGGIVLAHHSVKDFLFSNRGRPYFEPYALNPLQAQAYISKQCLMYLHIPEFKSGTCASALEVENRLIAYPLLHYAAHSWPSHFQQGSKDDPWLWHLIILLMQPSRTAQFQAWTQLLVYRSRNPQSYDVSRIHYTPLYFAASFGLSEVVDELLKRGADINERGGTFGGTPLHAAIWRCHQHVVIQLLEAGADDTIVDFNKSTGYDLMPYAGSGTVLK